MEKVNSVLRWQWRWLQISESAQSYYHLSKVKVINEGQNYFSAVVSLDKQK